MRIGVLAKGGADWMGGVYYTLNLVRALRSLPIDQQPDVFLLIGNDDQREPFREIADLAEVCVVPPQETSVLPAPVINPALVRLLADKGVDLIFPCMRSLGADFATPWLAWVPDFQHVHHREFFSEEECRQRDAQFGRLAADARLVVVSSQDALADFERLHPAQRGKGHVLRFATVPPSEWLTPDLLETVRRFGLPDRYLILPNQFWAHKNHAVAFEAVALLAERGLDVHLVCTGRTDDPRRPEHFGRLMAFVESRRIRGRIHVLGLIDRLQQIQVMRAAAAVVQPSLFEGWSTVVEDARALGKRIFLSDIPVHREQYPDGAIYFDPHRADLLAAAILAVWDSPCAAREQEAVAAQQARVTAYARAFLAIAGELLGAYER